MKTYIEVIEKIMQKNFKKKKKKKEKEKKIAIFHNFPFSFGKINIDT